MNLTQEKHHPPDFCKDSPAQFAEAATIAPARASSSLAALLTGHLLQDGEVILLVLKPSRWFILLSSLRWAAAIAIMLVAAKIYDDALPGKNALYVEAGVFVMAGRLMFAVVQWMNRLYVLTDMRVLRLAGIFSPELFDCPLRKVAGTRISYTTRERILGLGSIDIVSSDASCGWAQWQTIAKPREVHEQIIAAINRAKQGSNV
jgi:Bacterial PH domain